LSATGILIFAGLVEVSGIPRNSLEFGGKVPLTLDILGVVQAKEGMLGELEAGRDGGV
jgi:hypothetical protein